MGEKDKAMLLNQLIEEFGSPGILVDPDIAKATPCRCYTVHDKPTICYSKGVMGTLSKAQKEAFCNPLIKLGESERALKFAEAAKEAHKKIEKLPKGERLGPWLTEMGKKLRERGIEL
ncbi:hypothetical protein ES702_01414 [subsurface metagenome]